MTATAVDHHQAAQEAGDALDCRLLRGAVDVVLRALSASRPDQPATIATPGSPAPLIGDKVRCEAAMLLRATAALVDRHPALSSALARLTDALATPAVDELAVQLCLRPGVSLDLALVELHLRAIGLGDRRLDPLLEDLFGADRVHGPERPANRELEQLWLHAMWAGEVDSLAVARAVSSSSLAWEFDHLSGTTDDAYAFTHAILYASDHGRRRVRLPRPVEEVVADAEGILAVALDAGNHDLAAEALWTWPMLDLAWSPLAREARTFLAEVSLSWGFLPGPGFTAEDHQRLPSPDRDDYVLRTSYHTTLVYGLLMAATLAREDERQAPPRPGAGAAAGKEPRPGAAEVIAAMRPHCSRGEGWWDHLATRAPGARDRLAPALVAMALRRAVSQADLPTVHQILRVAADLNVATTPVSGQAGVLLRRSRHCLGLVAAPSQEPPPGAPGRLNAPVSPPPSTMGSRPVLGAPIRGALRR